MPTMVNNMGVIHASSGGVAPSFPDVCKTPTPPVGPIPIPYPNIAMSSDTASETKQTKVANMGVCVADSNFRMSTGDEAGVAGGVVSGKIKGKAEFINFSFDVMFENKGVARGLDLMLHNDKNTPPMPVIQAPT